MSLRRNPRNKLIFNLICNMCKYSAYFWRMDVSLYVLAAGMVGIGTVSAAGFFYVCRLRKELDRRDGAGTISAQPAISPQPAGEYDMAAVVQQAAANAIMPEFGKAVLETAQQLKALEAQAEAEGEGREEDKNNPDTRVPTSQTATVAQDGTTGVLAEGPGEEQIVSMVYIMYSAPEEGDTDLFFMSTAGIMDELSVQYPEVAKGNGKFTRDTIARALYAMGIKAVAIHNTQDNSISRGYKVKKNTSGKAVR